MELYDLVKVKRCDDKEFINAIGIISKVHYKNLFEIIFIGKRLNELSQKHGILLFNEKELEGV
jgi:hypothetical protein